jgi:hypothetical protein
MCVLFVTMSSCCVLLCTSHPSFLSFFLFGGLFTSDSGPAYTKVDIGNHWDDILMVTSHFKKDFLIDTPNDEESITD